MRRLSLLAGAALALLSLGPAVLHAQVSPPAAASAGAGGPEAVIRAAESYLRVPYLHGGDSRAGMDCSGLVFRVYHDVVGLNLPRGVDALFRQGQPVAYPFHVGDLLFFDTNETGTISAPTHVGMYAGGGRFVHAASEGQKTGVLVSGLESPYYRARFLGARRVYPWPAPVLSLTVTDGHVVESRASPWPSRESLAIDVYNGMSGGGPLDIAVLRDGVEVLSQWIAPGARKPAEVSIVPDIGSWTVRVSRIFKGRELALVSFDVEE